MTLYAPLNNVAKKVSGLYAPVNGVAKPVSKLYGSQNGVAKLVWQKKKKDVDYIEFAVPSGSSQKSIGNVWSTPIIVEVMSTGTRTTIASRKNAWVFHSDRGDIVRIHESRPNYTFRNWVGGDTITNSSSALRVVYMSGSRWTVAAMPPMDHFTEDEAGTIAGNNFFAYAMGYIDGYPEGSLDTSKITTYKTNALAGFASGFFGILPENSFDFSNAISIGSGFMTDFAPSTWSAITSAQPSSTGYNLNCFNPTSASMRIYTNTSGSSKTVTGGALFLFKTTGQPPVIPLRVSSASPTITVTLPKAANPTIVMTKSNGSPCTTSSAFTGSRSGTSYTLTLTSTGFSNLTGGIVQICTSGNYKPIVIAVD